MSASPPQKVSQLLDKEAASLHQDALDANGQDSAVVHGATILSPIITNQPSGFLAKLTNGHPNNDIKPNDGVPDNFVLTGKIQPFNQKDLTLEFYSYHGPLPDDSKVIPGEGSTPVYQMAIFDRGQKLSISKLIPQFAGTTFDSLAIENIDFIYQNMAFDSKKALGFTLEADIVFNEDHGQVHDVLSKFLGISDPKVHLSCALGVLQDWHKPFSFSSFQLEGVFSEGIPSPASQTADAHLPLDSMNIHNVGVRLIGYRSASYSTDGSLVLSNIYSYTVFGELSFKLLPVPVSFEISECEGLVSLTLKLDEWKQAFRIPQLSLEQLKLTTTFDPKNIKSSFSFGIQALMDIGSSVIRLEGQYSMDGTFLLNASVSNFDFDDLTGLFCHFYSADLVKPDLDIKFGSAVLGISGGSNGSTFSLDIQNLTVGDHHGAGAHVQLSSKGVIIDVKFLDKLSYTCGSHNVEILNAAASVSFIPNRKSADGKVIRGSTDILIQGSMDWETHTALDVVLHLYRCSKTGNMEYTILAQFTSGNGVPISSVVPVLDHQIFREITVQSAGLAIASRADPEIGALGIPCPLNQGFQVYAVLGTVKQMNYFMKQVPQLILRAGWEKNFALEFDILCTGFHIDFGKGITSDDIELTIKLGLDPIFCISGGIKIPIHHQKDPLDFTMMLSVGEVSAQLKGDLKCKSGWNDPFGISDELTIEKVDFMIGINYLTFLEEGPSDLGFKGKFEIDKVPVDVKFVVSSIPSNELLTANVGKLTIGNLVKFTGSLLRVDLPPPPDVIIFEAIKICMASTDVTYVQNVPPGFSFHADVVVFGIKASSYVEIGSSGFRCTGSVDPFTLGPLTVSGSTPKTSAKLDICLTKDRHYGMIDGSITIFGLQSAIKVTFEMHPKLTFDFYFMLKFADVFDLQVEASSALVVSATNSNATQREYTLRAEFEQDIRNHISQKIDELFKEKARLEAQEDATTEKELDAEKDKYQQSVDEAKRKYEAALKEKQELIDKRRGEANKVLQERKIAVQETQKKLDQEQASLRKKVADEKAKLTAEAAKAAQDLENIKQKLEAKRKAVAKDLDEAHRALDHAVVMLHQGFSNAENTANATKAKVDNLKGQIAAIDGRIESCRKANWYDLPAKAAIPGLEAEKLVLEGAIKLADAALQAANEILQSSDHFICKDAVNLANRKLSDLQAVSDEAIKGLEDGLTGAENVVKDTARKLGSVADDVATQFCKAIDEFKAALVKAQGLVTEAQETFNNVEATLEKEGAFVVCKGAEDLLTGAKKAGSAGLTLAKTGVKVFKAVDQELLKVWEAILKDVDKMVDITDVTITGELGKAVKSGFAFDAEIKGTFRGDDFFHFSVQYDHNAVEAFFKKIFDELVKLVEKGFLNIGKELHRVEGGGTVAVKYSPNGTFSIQHL